MRGGAGCVRPPRALDPQPPPSLQGVSWNWPFYQMTCQIYWNWPLYYPIWHSGKGGQSRMAHRLVLGLRYRIERTESAPTDKTMKRTRSLYARAPETPLAMVNANLNDMRGLTESESREVRHCIHTRRQATHFHRLNPDA